MRPLGALPALLAGLLLVAVSPAALAAESKVVFSQSSPYHRVNVVDNDKGERCLNFGKLKFRQACMRLDGSPALVDGYAKLMLASLYLQPDPGRILLLGLGGGVLAKTLHQLYPQATIDAVDIDPVVIAVADRFFGVRANAQLRIVESDARVFARQARLARASYDLIVVDTFNADYVPEHLLTVEYFQELKALLTPQGVLVANTFAFSRLYDHESTTYHAVFGDFYYLRRANRIIIAEAGTPRPQAAITTNAARLAPALQPYGVRAEELLPLFQRDPDWDPAARPLTDQYAPANLLGRPAWLTWGGVRCLLGFGVCQAE